MPVIEDSEPLLTEGKSSGQRWQFLTGAAFPIALGNASRMYRNLPVKSRHMVLK
jgi:hypothetical protein